MKYDTNVKLFLGSVFRKRDFLSSAISIVVTLLKIAGRDSQL